MTKQDIRNDIRDDAAELIRISGRLDALLSKLDNDDLDYTYNDGSQSVNEWFDFVTKLSKGRF